MFKYILRRLLVMVPTLLGITVISFIIINLAPGSPVEQKLQQMRWGEHSGNRGDAQVSEEVVEALKKQYGFDKPLHIRYIIWLKNIFTLNFGDSFKFNMPVTQVVMERLPVSIQFGLLSFIFIYLVCIPLGVWKAVRDGTAFDKISGFLLFLMYSTPPLMLGILLIVFFAGGTYFNWFPSGEISSLNYDELTTWGKIVDRAHHFVLPLICYMINSFTTLTLLMKNSLLEEIKHDYVRTARAKGLDEKVVVFKHALRNALIPIATGIGSFFGLFLAGSIIIEEMFSLNGIGRLGFTSALERDYNVLMALILFSALTYQIGRLISDILYVVIDPRIDFE